jgi:hypothetical protein
MLRDIVDESAAGLGDSRSTFGGTSTTTTDDIVSTQDVWNTRFAQLGGEPEAIMDTGKLEGAAYGPAWNAVTPQKSKIGNTDTS